LELAILLQWGKQELIATSETSGLDAEILLANVLNVSRSYLLAFSEREITPDESALFRKLIQQRKQGIPIAYLTGQREFWSLDLRVTPDTLIPRPETELLVELVLCEQNHSEKILADLGTGSGAIALAIAHERPAWKIYATDFSEKALQVAQLNAERLQLKNVIFQQGSWCAALPKIKFDIIVSNPPYIAFNDPALESNVLRYEPQSALIAAENGLAALRCIVMEAKAYLQPKGKLMLEHGSEQGALVRSLFAEEGYQDIETYRDLAGFERVTLATG
jgi:release factor glutamine methyltransferase